jgi:hypothetical protein
MTVSERNENVSQDTSVETIEQACPACWHRFDRASEMHFQEQQTPKAGDISICIKCAQVSIFLDSTGRLRKADAKDIRELMNNAEVWQEIERARAAVKQAERT